MSSGRAYASDSYNEGHNSRTRSTSTASSSRSSSSRDSGDSLERSRRSSSAQSPKPKHHKSGSFGRLFGAKEPSLDSFKQLAEQQQKELEKKGQKLPFGVSESKLPSSVKDDYKKAKQRAKERAKLHEAMKEKMKLNDGDEGQHGHTRKSSTTSLTVDEDQYLRSPHHPQYAPASPRSVGKRFSALEPLPEATSTDGVSGSIRPTYPPSPPLSDQYRRSPVRDNGLLSGSARKDALPWE